MKLTTHTSRSWPRAPTHLPLLAPCTDARGGGQHASASALSTALASCTFPRAGPCTTTAMRQHAVLGYCGTNRTADVAAKRASCVSTYGRWYTPGTQPSLQECARRCTACDSCRFVSFSAQTVDCSLYAACNVARLTRSYGYTTLDVRHLSASDLLESPSPPISPPPPLALRHNWSAEMSAAVDDHTSGEWHGRLWIPPFKLMSTHRARELTRNRSLLFVGDSTARRFAATLARFLEHASEHEKSGSKPTSF